MTLEWFCLTECSFCFGTEFVNSETGPAGVTTETCSAEDVVTAFPKLVSRWRQCFFEGFVRVLKNVSSSKNVFEF